MQELHVPRQHHLHAGGGLRRGAGPVGSHKEPKRQAGCVGSRQEQDTRAFPQLPELCVCCGQLLLDLNNCTGDKPRDTHTLSPFKADTCPRPATESIDLAEKNTPDSSDASTRMTIPSGGGAIPPQGVEVKQGRRETDSNVGWGHLVFFNKSNHISKKEQEDFQSFSVFLWEKENGSLDSLKLLLLRHV